MNRAALVLAVIACAIAAVSFTRPQPSTGEGVVDAAKQYVQDIAKQNSLKVDGIKIVAVRETGNEAVVRLIVRYHPYLQITPTQTVKGPETTVTLGVHLHRSSWNAGYAQ